MYEYMNPPSSLFCLHAPVNVVLIMYKLYLKENYDTSTRQETCCENLYIRSVGLSFEGMVTHLTFLCNSFNLYSMVGHRPIVV